MNPEVESQEQLLSPDSRSVAAELAQDDVELLWKLIEQSPGLEITVNLQDRNVTAGTVVLPFKIDDYTGNLTQIQGSPFVTNGAFPVSIVEPGQQAGRA